MTEPEEKKKGPVVPTREPKKKVPGIFDNLRKLPEPHPVEEILGLTPTTGSTPSTGSTGSTPSRDTTPSTPPRPSTPSRRRSSQPVVAPERDFTRVANSIVRHAVPSGIFGEQGGKAKELYDTLYVLTRGAVVPQRKVRIPKDRLMKKAGIGSEVTLRKNLQRLRSVRLVSESVVPGAHGGNEYEVFLPEEVGLDLPTGATPSTPSTPGRGSSPRQMREGVEALDSTGSSPGPDAALTTTSSESKTFSKDQRTIDDDDAALAGLVSTLKSVAAEVTGRETSETESERWREVAEVLAAELRIAAARTTVSSAPAFLAEHLRRRLWKIDKRQAQAEGRELPDQAQSAPQEAAAARSCPDCGGSGWWYPDGTERGVKKCRHEKIEREST
jgi:hypothetical protein